MRIVLKLSGEALAGGKKTGFDEEVVKRIATQVQHLVDNGTKVGIVIGGGNFWRGKTGTEIDRAKSDQIGMLATVMNSIYVSEVFRSAGMRTRIFTPFACGTMTELFSKDEVNACFAEGRVVFFAGGTGHPFFSTDTGVVLRAAEMEADLILLAKAVDGIYSGDPKTDPEAKKYETISIQEVIDHSLQVIDTTAAVMARDNRLPMRVFALDEPNSIINALGEQFSGTTVTI